MSFHVGQKVVCVDASNTRRVTAGQIYTVGRLHLPFLTLDSVRGTFAHGMQATRFRPLIERKTDISIFTEMLKPKQLERIEH